MAPAVPVTLVMKLKVFPVKEKRWATAFPGAPMMAFVVLLSMAMEEPKRSPFAFVGAVALEAYEQVVLEQL